MMTNLNDAEDSFLSSIQDRDVEKVDDDDEDTFVQCTPVKPFKILVHITLNQKRIENKCPFYSIPLVNIVPN
jgi:hypothetical protein